MSVRVAFRNYARDGPHVTWHARELAERVTRMVGGSRCWARVPPNVFLLVAEYWLTPLSCMSYEDIPCLTTMPPTARGVLRAKYYRSPIALDLLPWRPGAQGVFWDDMSAWHLVACEGTPWDCE